MKRQFPKAVRLARDIIIDIFLIFVGLLYVTRAWPRFEAVFGLFFVLAGMLIAMKVNVKPFSDLSPKATLAAYFSREADDTASRQRRFQRISVVFLAIPILFFIPIVLVVGDVDKMQGYMAVSFFVGLISIFCGVVAGVLMFRNWFQSNRS